MRKQSLSYSNSTAGDIYPASCRDANHTCDSYCTNYYTNATGNFYAAFDRYFAASYASNTDKLRQVRRHHLGDLREWQHRQPRARAAVRSLEAVSRLQRYVPDKRRNWTENTAKYRTRR